VSNDNSGSDDGKPQSKFKVHDLVKRKSQDWPREGVLEVIAFTPAGNILLNDMREATESELTSAEED
jgi:hypothetical protein